MIAAIAQSVRTLPCLALGTLAVLTSAPALAHGGNFIESGGIVVIDLGYDPPVGDWSRSTQTPQYSGQGYVRWDGPDFFAAPSVAGTFEYGLDITTPGVYVFNLRNRHEDPNPTEDNDVWVQMDGGPWEKVFSNGASSVGNWTWEARVEDPAFTYPQQSYSLTAGPHTLRFSGRSNGFKMDRLHLAQAGHPDSFNLGRPQSPRRIGAAYGVANPNSTGQVGRLEGRGSQFVVHGDVTLNGDRLPPGAVGFFIVSDTQMFFANPGGSSGNVLVGPSIGRYSGNVLVVNGQGRVSMPVNLGAIPRPNGPAATTAGATWNFQYWHRDSAGGSPTSNFSQGLSITFE